MDLGDIETLDLDIEVVLLDIKDIYMNKNFMNNEDWLY